MEDLFNAMRREAQRMDQRHAKSRVGLVTSWDPDKHAAKVKLQPEDVETGWLPVASSHIGDGHGIAVGLTPGDQVTVGFQEGDVDTPVITGRVFSDKDKPPRAESGELVIKHKSGAIITIDKTGAMTVKNVTGAMTIDAGTDLAIKAAGAIDITSATLKHNGKNIGDTHVHGGIVVGGSDTSTPH
ncbi:phage baseplate assembly protein V [Alsobacter metallidurans]|nr:phage baseplate assembly protein V [Alsobacter metallidurans]